MRLLLICFCLLSTLCSVMVISSRNPIHSILFLILVFCCVAFILIILNLEFIAILFLIVYVGAIAVLFLFVVMMLNIKILELEEPFWKFALMCFVAIASISTVLFVVVFSLGFPLSAILTDVSCSTVTYISTEFDSPNMTDVYLLNMLFKEHILQLIPYYNKLVVLGFLPGILPNGIYDTGEFVDLDNGIIILEPFATYFFPYNLISNVELFGWLLYTHNFFLLLVISFILFIAIVGSIVLVLNQNINIRRQVIFRQTMRSLKESVSLKSTTKVRKKR